MRRDAEEGGAVVDGVQMQAAVEQRTRDLGAARLELERLRRLEEQVRPAAEKLSAVMEENRALRRALENKAQRAQSAGQGVQGQVVEVLTRLGTTDTRRRYWRKLQCNAWIRRPRPVPSRAAPPPPFTPQSRDLEPPPPDTLRDTRSQFPREGPAAPHGYYGAAPREREASPATGVASRRGQVRAARGSNWAAEEPADGYPLVTPTPQQPGPPGRISDSYDTRSQPALGGMREGAGKEVDSLLHANKGPSEVPPFGCCVESAKAGVRISSITTDGPAWAAGMREGDGIFHIDGEEVNSAADILRVIHDHDGEVTAVWAAGGRGRRDVKILELLQ